MADFTEPEMTVLQTLKDKGATTEQPVSLLEIGPSLVSAGYTEHQIVNLLFSLESKNAIDLLDGNRARFR